MTAIVFSHGFGVKADARGMFTQIAANFPEYNTVMFDYNLVLGSGDIVVAPLGDQVWKLQETLNEQIGEVVLVAHSQGCVVAAMADLHNVQKVILLAPPTDMSAQRVVDKLMKKPGAEVNLDGISKLPRTDGTITHISKEYIESLHGVDPIILYTKIAAAIKTVIIRCTQDEVLGLTNVNEVPNAKHIDIESNHDFTGEARQRLIDIIKFELTQ